MTVHVLTRQVGKGAGDILNFPDIIIPPGQTVEVDSCPCTYLSTKWFITIYNQTELISHSAEILANHIYQTNPEHQRYGVVGSEIQYETEVVISGGAFVLQITNNELYDMYVSVIQLRTTTQTG